jgi:hypothetical protein
MAATGRAGRVDGRTILVLAGLMLLFFARAGWWMSTSEIPILDEAAHYNYIQDLAEGHYPVTGQTTVGRDSILISKDDPIDYFRGLSLPTEPGVEWGLTDQSYEAFQPPLYYLLSVPAYAIGRPFGPLGALYAIRIWTVLLVSLGIPLLYLAARELFPKRPAAWLLAPAVLTGVQMVVSNLSQITNDAIMIPLGAGALWALGRYFNRSTYTRAAVVGVALGLAFLGKTTAVTLLAGAIVALAGLLVSRRREARRLLAGGGIAAIVALVIVAPWLALNEHQYHALTGIKANAALVLPLTGRLPKTSSEVRALVTVTRNTLWATQYGGQYRLGYTQLWEGAVAVTVGAGVLVSLARRRFGEAATVLWLTAIAPLGFVILVWSLFSQAGGVGGILGRHLAVAVPALCLAAAAGAVLAAEAWLAAIALLSFLTVASGVEVRIDRSYITTAYAQPIFANTAPVVNQPWSDATVDQPTLRITPTCPVTLVGLATPDLRGALGPAIPTVSFQSKPLPAVGADFNYAVYALPTPQRAPFELTVTGTTPIQDSTTHISPDLTVVSAAGARPAMAESPTARLYCPSGDPAAARFAVFEHPDHPALSYQFIRDWPLVSPVAYGVAAIVVAVALRPATLRRRRRPQPRPRHLHSQRLN